MQDRDKIVSEYLGYSDHFQVFREQLEWQNSAVAKDPGLVRNSH